MEFREPDPLCSTMLRFGGYLFWKEWISYKGFRPNWSRFD